MSDSEIALSPAVTRWVLIMPSLDHDRGGAGVHPLFSNPAHRFDPAAADAGSHGGDRGRTRLDNDVQRSGDRDGNADVRLAVPRFGQRSVMMGPIPGFTAAAGCVARPIRWACSCRGGSRGAGLA